MRTAKIGELKARLSAHIDYVKRGEEVLILDGDKPVAKLVGVEPSDDFDEQTRRLIAKGVLTPPIEQRKPGEEWPVPPGPMAPQKAIDRMWEDEREGR